MALTISCLVWHRKDCPKLELNFSINEQYNWFLKSSLCVAYTESTTSARAIFQKKF